MFIIWLVILQQFWPRKIKVYWSLKKARKVAIFTEALMHSQCAMIKHPENVMAQRLIAFSKTNHASIIRTSLPKYSRWIVTYKGSFQCNSIK